MKFERCQLRYIQAAAVVLFLTCSCSSHAQISKLRGVVSIHNSEFETGKREFVALAAVRPADSSANHTVTSTKGKFELEFVGVREKSTVEIVVVKHPLEVVNIGDLTAVAGQLDEVKISMALPSKIAEFRARIYNVGFTEAHKQLARLVGEKDRQISALSAAKDQDRERIRTLEKEKQLLSEKLARVKAQSNDLADRYSIINMDDASDIYRRAFASFQRGQIDSALLLLETFDAEKAIEQLNRLRNDRRLIDSLETASQNNARQIVRLKLDLSKTTRFETDIVMSLYDQLMQIDPADADLMFEYAEYSSKNYKLDKALQLFERRLKFAATDSLVSVIKFEIGLIHQANHDYDRAEQALKESLQIQSNLYSKEGTEYVNVLARTQNSLGNVYIRKGDLAAASTVISDALNLQTTTSNAVDSKGLLNLSSIYGSLGLLSDVQDDIVLSEQALNKSIALSKEQIEKGKVSDEVILQYSSDLRALSVLYRKRGDMSRATEALDKSLSHLNKLSDSKRLEYLSQKVKGHYAKTIMKMATRDPSGCKAERTKTVKYLSQLGELNPTYVQNEFSILRGYLGIYGVLWIADDSSKVFLENAIKSLAQIESTRKDFYKNNLAEIEFIKAHYYAQKRLYDRAESSFLNSIGDEKGSAMSKANTWFDLASTYEAEGKDSLAKDAFEKTLTLARENRERMLEIAQSSIANAQFRLFRIYSRNNIPDKAIACATEARFIYLQLAMEDPVTIEPQLATLKWELGMHYFNRNEFSRSCTEFTGAVEIQSRLVTRNRDFFLPFMVTIRYNLGLAYAILYRSAEAESEFRDALLLQADLIEKDKAYVPFGISIRKQLAMVYRNQGKFDESIEVLEEILPEQETYVTIDSAAYLPFYCDIAWELSQNYLTIRNYVRAEEYALKALAGQTVLVKSNSGYLPFFATINNTLGNIYANQGDLSKAMQHHRTALDSQGKSAEHHPWLRAFYLKIVTDVLDVYSRSNRLAEARTFINAEIRKQKRNVQENAEEVPYLAGMYLASGYLYRMSSIDSAVVEMTNAAVLLEKNRSPSAENIQLLASIYSQMGAANFSRGKPFYSNYTKAIALLTKIEPKTPPVQAALGQAHFEAANCLWINQRSYYLTLSHLGKASNIYYDLNKRDSIIAQPFLVDVLYYQGMVTRQDPTVFSHSARVEKNKTALVYLEEAKARQASVLKYPTRSPTAMRRYGEILYEMSQIYFSDSSWRKSEANLDEALSLKDELLANNNTFHYPFFADVHGTLGIVYYNTRQFDKSVATLQEGLRFQRVVYQANPVGSKIFMGHVLLNLGKALVATKQYDSGIAHLEEALTYYDARNPASKFPEWIDYATYELAKAHAAKGENEKAVNMIQPLITDLRSMYENDIWMDKSLLQLSEQTAFEALLALKRYDHAIRLMVGGVELRRPTYRKLPFLVFREMIFLHNSLSQAYKLNGDYKDAIHELTKVLEIKRQYSGSPEEVKITEVELESLKTIAPPKRKR